MKWQVFGFWAEFSVGTFRVGIIKVVVLGVYFINILFYGVCFSVWENFTFFANLLYSCVHHCVYIFVLLISDDILLLQLCPALCLHLCAVDQWSHITVTAVPTANVALLLRQTCVELSMLLTSADVFVLCLFHSRHGLKGLYPCTHQWLCCWSVLIYWCSFTLHSHCGL